MPKPGRERMANLIHRERFQIRLPGRCADRLVRDRCGLDAEGFACDEGACRRDRLVHQWHRGQTTTLPAWDGDVRDRFLKVDVGAGETPHLGRPRARPVHQLRPNPRPGCLLGGAARRRGPGAAGAGCQGAPAGRADRVRRRGGSHRALQRRGGLGVYITAARSRRSRERASRDDARRGQLDRADAQMRGRRPWKAYGILS